MTHALHMLTALLVLTGTAAQAQRDANQRDLPGNETSSTPRAGGVEIGQPQAIGRPEAIGSPQSVGQPQTIGGAPPQGNASTGAQLPAPLHDEEPSHAVQVELEPQHLDDGVDLSPMTDEEQLALEAAAAEARSRERAPSYLDGAPEPDLSAEAGTVDAEPLTEEEAQAIEAVQGSAQQNPLDPSTGGSGGLGDVEQTAPGLILGPTSPSTGAMIAPSATPQSVSPDTEGATPSAPSPSLEVLESLDATGARTEQLQTEQLEVLEDLASQSEIARQEEAAYAQSVTETQGESARALNLVDEANRAVMRGESDVSRQVTQAQASVVAAAEEARARGSLAREEQLGRALLWLEAARISGENRDSVTAMRQLEEARLALNGVVPSDPIPIYE